MVELDGLVVMGADDDGWGLILGIVVALMLMLVLVVVDMMLVMLMLKFYLGVVLLMLEGGVRAT